MTHVHNGMSFYFANTCHGPLAIGKNRNRFVETRSDDLCIPQKPDQCDLRDGPLGKLMGGGGGGRAGEVQKKIFAQGKIK